MPALDLNNPNNVYLVQSGFNVQDIEKSPTLVNLLNRFQGNLLIDEQDTTVSAQKPTAIPFILLKVTKIF